MNLAAPNPLPNADFMRVLRESWWHPVRSAGEQVDARDRRLLHAMETEPHSEEPARRSGAIARTRIHFRVSGVAFSRARTCSGASLTLAACWERCHSDAVSAV